MCEMGNFLASQANAYELSNYNYAWSVRPLESSLTKTLTLHLSFGNYTIADPTNGADYNGAVHV